MALKKRMCANHPRRPAIGVCVITKAAICAECSTRYEGINYSREGLEILKAQRAAAAEAHNRGRNLALFVSLLFSPVLLFLLFLFYQGLLEFLIDVQQFEWSTF